MGLSTFPSPDAVPAGAPTWGATTRPALHVNGGATTRGRPRQSVRTKAQREAHPARHYHQ